MILRISLRLSSIRLLLLPLLFAAGISLAGESGKKGATDTLGKMHEPLATGLDMHSFNPDPEITAGQIGEILFLYDTFLAQQGISLEGTSEDLNKLHDIIRRDYELVKEREKVLDDRYDELKDKFEELEEALEDKEEDADLPEYLRLIEQAAPIKEKRNLLRDYLEFEKPLLKTLEKAQDSPENERLREEACNIAIRSMYSLFSGQLMDERNSFGFKNGFKGGMRVVRQFVDRAHLNGVHYLDQNSRKRPVGKLRAKNQAKNLVSPDAPDRFLTQSELAKLSHAEVAELDVAPTNPMWHTRQVMETKRPDTWKQIEDWLSKEVTDELLDSKKFKKKHPDFKYDLTQARRVLFWDDVKSTATSPKIDTTDAFGKEWKLKWGEESMLEPITNRLRLKLGAKFADLTYNNVGGTSHLLILPSKLEKEMNPDKVMPLSVDEFIDAMAESKYEFNARPFILASGIITEANADEILKNLPDEAPKKRKAKNLTGQVWIKFRESMVEVKHDAFEMGGPISIHGDFTHYDRAMRQCMLFGLWLEHVDIKEDNHRAMWIKDFDGFDGRQYFEFFHDPGSSLGGQRNSGEVNQLKFENQTGGFLWVSPGGNVVLSSSFQLYRPGIWDNIEFADYLAAAKHLVRLTKEDIGEAVDASYAPDFYKECMTWRLTKRRDTTAEIFGLPLPDSGAGPAPNISVPLTSRSDRRAAAARYHIPLSEIEDDLVRTGYLLEAKRSGDTITPFTDVIVKDGTIQAYHETVLTGIVKDHRHPAGFVGRMNRWTDGDEYVSIRFQQKK